MIDVVARNYARWFAPPQTAVGTAVRQDIELLRVLSAAAIVWFHCGGVGSSGAHAGLMVFVMLSIFFAGKGKPVALRARRLLVPWLVWDLFYAGFNVARGQTAFPFSHGLVSAVLGGSMFHLWYLPYIFAVLVALDFARKRMGMARLSWLGLALLALSMLFAPGIAYWGIHNGTPFIEYSCVLQSTCFGIFVAGYTSLPVWPRRLALAVLALIVTSQVVRSGLPILAVGPLAMAWTTWLLLFRQPRAWSVDMRPLSNCAFGVYLLHPLVLMLALHWQVPRTLLLSLGVFVVTLGLVLLARRYAPDFARYAL